MERRMVALVLAVMLVVSLGCSLTKGKDEATEGTPVPSVTAAAARTQATATPVAQESSEPESLEAEDLIRNEAGGFAYRPIEGYVVETSGETVVLVAPDADVDGPAIVMMGGEFWVDATPEDLLELFAEEEGFETDAPTEVSVGGVTGAAADQRGTGVLGRAVALMPASTQGFVVIARAPEERWSELEAELDTVLASVTFFTPVAGAAPEGGGEAETEARPVLGEPSGWSIYSDVNEVRGLAYHEGVLYAGGMGGVAAWDMATGEVRKMTTLDGLSHISVRDAVYCEVPLSAGEEPRPAVVVGTDAGLSVYDVESMAWTVLDPGLEGFPPTRQVARVFCDAANGRLLVSSDGLGIWDFVNGTWQRVTSSEGLLWNEARGMAVRGDEIWVGSGYNGVSVVEDGVVTATYDEAGGLPDNRVHSIALGGDGQTLWMGTSKGLVKVSGTQYTVYGPDTVDGMPSGGLYRVVTAPDGTLWVGSETGAVCHFAPASGSCVETYEAEGAWSYVSALIVDDAGGAIFADGYTAVHYQSGGAWETLVYTGEPVASNFVDAIAEDAEGMLWVGTNMGQQRLDPADVSVPWDIYTEEDGTGGGRARSIALGPDGVLWFAMVNGDATRYVDGEWTVKEGLRSANVVAADAQGRGWFGTDDGVVIWDGAGETTLTEADGLPHPEVNALVADGEAMWIGTSGGVARWEGDSVEVVLDKDVAALNSGYVQALALLGDGTLLVGTGGGLAHYDGVEATALPAAGTAVRAITVGPDGRIWIAAGETLRYSDDDGTTWTALTAADGLPTNYVNAIFVDRFGTLWISGGNDFGGGGLARWVP